MTDHLHPETATYIADITAYSAQLLALVADGFPRENDEVDHLLAQAADKYIAEDLAKAIALEAVSVIFGMTPDAHRHKLPDILKGYAQSRRDLADEIKAEPHGD